MQKKRSLTGSGLIWLGAAISIAEIYTGALLAPLGTAAGTAAIVIGHAIGGALMYLAALIGARSGRGAMESVSLSFGEKGAKFFAAMNVLQLLGWTAVMIIGGSRAAAVVLDPLAGFAGQSVWAVVIGALIALWVALDIENFEKMNRFAMVALFFLTVVLSFVVFRGDGAAAVSGSMTFGAAVELSAAMPLSWLPLISDYTRDAEKPEKAALVSTAVYFAASCWMYLVGLGAAIFSGTPDIAQIMLSAGLGLAGVLIIIFSTVTTTFLDAYSGGVSFAVIFSGAAEKKAALAICAIGTALAVFTPVESYESYLYLISSVFGPMISIMTADFYILKKDCAVPALNARSFALWCAGFVLYRVFLALDPAIGSTLPTMALTVVMTCAAEYLMRTLRPRTAG